MVVHSGKNVDLGLLDVDLFMMWKLKDVFVFFIIRKKRGVASHLAFIHTEGAAESCLSVHNPFLLDRMYSYFTKRIAHYFF